jgi:tetratricopeptide (TPR) repeat protein
MSRKQSQSPEKSAEKAKNAPKKAKKAPKKAKKTPKKAKNAPRKARKAPKTPAKAAKTARKPPVAQSPPDAGGAAATAAVKDAFKQAIGHYRAGELARAEKICRRIVPAAPEYFDAHYLLGAVATRRRKPELAAEAFAAAAAADPGHADSHINLGLAQRNLDRLEAAAASIRRGLEINPGHAEGHNHLGRTLQELGDADGAIASFRRAVEINNMGNVLRHEKEFDEAAACYRRVVEINADLPIGHNNLGKALKGLEQTDEAEASFRRAITADADFADAHICLADLLAEQKRPEEAEAGYRRALELKGDDAKVLHGLGNALKDQERMEEAAATFEHALEVDPDAAEIHNSLGIARKHLEDIDGAIAAYRRSIELWPDNAEAYNNLGNALKDQDKLDEAIAAYRAAIDLRENFAEAYCNLAKVHEFTPGDPVLQTLKNLYELDEVSADNKNHLLVALGTAHEQTGAYDEAFAYHTKANRETAAERPYSAPGHRKRIKLIKGWFKEPAPPPVGPRPDQPLPIFAIGMSRSGKTLVESFLAQLDGVYAAGESHAWTDAVKEVFEKHKMPSEFPDCMEVITPEQIAEIGARYLDIMAAEAPDAGCFVNTMPSNYPYVGLILMALPWAKVVYTYRDPLDNCLISYFYRYRTGNGYSYDLRNVGAYYGDYQVIMTHWLKLYGDRIHPVRYETMVRKPDEVVPGIFEFCGLEYDPGAIEIDVNTDEIGRWKNYDAHLAPLREGLGRWLQLSAGRPRKSA